MKDLMIYFSSAVAALLVLRWVLGKTRDFIQNWQAVRDMPKTSELAMRINCAVHKEPGGLYSLWDVENGVAKRQRVKPTVPWVIQEMVRRIAEVESRVDREWEERRKAISGDSP